MAPTHLPPPRAPRILIVDDSAVVREVVAHLLTEDGAEVTVAADPIIALQKLAQARPDAIVLDIEMPRMDGLTFLRRVMAEAPVPVVVCSGLAGPGTELSLQALEEGAVDVIAKPRLGVRDFLHESAVRLLEAVRAATQARPAARTARGEEPATRVHLKPLSITTDKVVAIGASTGGTEALRTILEALPPDSPGVVVVQHMPEVFTAAFARRLDEVCQVEVKEAADRDRVQPGRVLTAPGNRHVVVQRDGAHYAVRLDDGPLVSRHRPSVDVLFLSVARAVGRNAVGVLLTGMGADGAHGLLEMRRTGAATIAQDEATCVVFGMPKEAISLGAADLVLPLGRIANAILREACHATPTARSPGPGGRARLIAAAEEVPCAASSRPCWARWP